MSNPQPTAFTFKKEETFTAYTPSQSQAYASLRPDYSPAVYDLILAHHASTGGRLDTLLDLGTGPGLVARALAPHFQHALGVDPSEGMLATARTLGGASASGEPIRYALGTAEDPAANLDVADGSVDLITAGNAAHWFNMPEFWPAAARVLRAGGSVALWTSGETGAHPDMPAAAGVQAVFERYQREWLLPYFEPGNLLTMNGYATLPLPWQVSPPVREFDEGTFFRKQWQLGEDFYRGIPTLDMEKFEMILSTGSPVTRWRQANPEKVGTEEDVLRRMRRDIEKLLHEAGVKEGEEKLVGAVNGVLIIVKRK